MHAPIQTPTHSPTHPPSLRSGLAVLASLLAALRLKRVARFATVSAERFILVRPAASALARDALVGELRSLPRAADTGRQQSELRLFDGVVSLHDASGALRFRASADVPARATPTSGSGSGSDASDAVEEDVAALGVDVAAPRSTASSSDVPPLRGAPPTAFPPAPPPLK